ncbi:hypothetical protein AUEXF2481DRAFT_388214 [Aureobasidium subglaciale EXF-2481]|uniref:Uncharacterized protein n=1 Tax=Aureobasidium subglaciale (strain EXF-2481) TaxID=1043005 RepID=A0A074YME3_AURSE|nr:uncharacterized protein AUEXF2481DRAFT_388214 [Aureobasidium subglaciale EXF-2481]KAI5205583.1 hypothetical protein E4T38_04192 [Aureobasidium subglaciale]KAI5224561.1 hypothetical protein E4T40_03997 [Aureobasidium subglaciale]KAI5227766.1 hypothetical protein E4T41_04217 [Aureobasidium subglaciale]KAI5263236.1 hypothetical protein E4T46_03838 [Aureobasidium subglaciale]KEQ98983.1 hypothetical protein AUEXF2481DRAFT_388214 [Aureobasidium subglaciale EXF-2481]
MPPLPDPLVLRLLRTDVDNDFVLVNVLQTGSDPLDVKLIATDGEFPFVTNILQKDIRKLQASSSQTDSDQWQSILSSILLQSTPNDPTLTGVEAVTSLSSSQLTITIRNKISGITQRLGAIVLDKDEDEAIQLYDWTGFAVFRADTLAHRLATFQSTVAEHQKRIDELTAQLDDLVKAKKSQQDEMLRKFAALLNTKKLKIRDQQRLLARAKVDPRAADHVQQVRSTTAGRKPDLSRSSKRKADDNIQEFETDDDDLEETDLGKPMNEADDMRQELDDPLTPDKSDLDTEDEESDGGFAPAPMPSQSSRSQASLRSKPKTLETVGPSEAKTAFSESPEIQLPPRRQLPFPMRNTTLYASRAPHQAAMSTTSSQTLPISSTTIHSSKPPHPMDDDDETDDEL